MTVRAIFATDDTWGIGKNGTLPWPRNKADLRWFRSCTENAVVMMGRRTWQDPALPKPLPNRYNVVVSDKGIDKFDTRPNIVIKRAQVENYLKQFEKDVWIIGGAQLLQSTLPHIQELWVSRIKGVFDCDTSIQLDWKQFRIYESHEYHDERLYIDKYKRY